VARRRRNSSGRIVGVLVLVGVGATAWYWWGGPSDPAPQTTSSRQDDGLPLATDRPEDATDGGPYADVPERGSAPGAAAATDQQNRERGLALVASGRQAMERQEAVTARAQFSEALQHDLPLSEMVKLRADLTRLARDTIFSTSITKDDPFVEAYVIQPGETLGKIARRFGVTDDFLARINDIPNKNRIRAGQRLKVVRGPFHAVVSKSDYSLDVYLQGTFLKRFPVGLGADDGTPTGRWRVAGKLKNPTYYPPRGGQIIAADDPDNPLGERWIGLEGVDGEAVGQERYGIHGTIEPDSIGSSVSMGCIRMHNADVEELFDLLIEGDSEVTVR